MKVKDLLYMYSVVYSKFVYCGLYCICKIIYKIIVFEEDIYRYNYSEFSFFLRLKNIYFVVILVLFKDLNF